MKTAGWALILMSVLTFEARAQFKFDLPVGWSASEQAGKSSLNTDSGAQGSNFITQKITQVVASNLPEMEKWAQLWATVRGVQACPPPPYRNYENLPPNNLANIYFTKRAAGEHCEAFKAAFTIVYGKFDDLPNNLSHQQVEYAAQWAVQAQQELMELKLYEDAALQGVRFVSHFLNGGFQTLTVEDTIHVRYKMVEALFLSAKKLQYDASNYYRNSGLRKFTHDGDFAASTEPLEVLLNLNNTSDPNIRISSFDGFTQDFEAMAEPKAQANIKTVQKWKIEAENLYLAHALAQSQDLLLHQPATTDPFRDGFSYAPLAIGAFLQMKALYVPQLLDSVLILDVLAKEIQYAFEVQQRISETSMGGQPVVRDNRLEMLTDVLFPRKENDGQQGGRIVVDRQKIAVGLTKVVCRTRDSLKTGVLLSPEWRKLQSDPATKARIDEGVRRIDTLLAGRCAVDSASPPPMGKKPSAPKQG